MSNKILEDIYNKDSFESKSLESEIKIEQITEKEKFKAAKQILLGLSVLYIFTISAYLFKPTEGKELLDIVTITFPPLTTLILAAYFRDKSN